jgi:hypothetical protein
MAKIKRNDLTEGFTGMFGKQIVFKNRLGTRYVTAPPEVNKNRKPTPAQKKIQDKLLRCNEYAIEAIKDAKLKEDYAAAATGGQTAVNVAFKDAWHAPVVHSITTNGYKRNAGDIIFIQATDNFRVVSVKVSIFDVNGGLIEEGAANQDGLMWMYTASRNADDAFRIVATAFDLPQNQGVMEANILT